MKKIFGILFIAVISLFCFSGCFSSGEGVDKIEIESYPKSTYVIDEEFDWSSLKVKVTLKDNTTKIVTGDPSQWVDATFKCSTASTANEGTYSVTVSYGDTLKATFQYTVLKSYFVNGNGTKENPFQISTLAQFKSMVKEHPTMTYYVLINDIDFNYNYTSPTAALTNVSLDGQGYSLKNVSNVVFSMLKGYTEIMNLNVYANFEGDKSWGVFYDDAEGIKHVFKNLNFYGLSSNYQYNHSLFGAIGINTENTTAIFENINNYMDLIGNGASGVFMTANWGLAYFINCSNYGTLISPSSTIITPNQAYNNDGIFVIKNMKNYGDVISTFVKTDALWGAPTTSGTTQSGLLKYSVNNEEYRYYNYNENLGYMLERDFTGYSDSDKLTDKDIEAIKVKDLIFVAPIIETKLDSSKAITLSAIAGNETKLQGKDLKIKVVISSHVIDLNGNYQCGQSVWEHIFVSNGDKTALELFNDYQLKALRFVNTENLSIKDCNYIGDNKVESEKDGLKITNISGTKYYVYDSTQTPFTDGVHSASKSDKAIYTIILLDSNDRPLSSTMFVQQK